MRAKDCVPAGGSFQVRAGEIFLPVHAYFAGMDCPFTNASLVSSRDIVTSVAGGSDDIVGWEIPGLSAVVAGAHDMSMRVNSKPTKQFINPSFMAYLLF
jgi:hypothetical protein